MAQIHKCNHEPKNQAIRSGACHVDVLGENGHVKIVSRRTAKATESQIFDVHLQCCQLNQNRGFSLRVELEKCCAWSNFRWAAYRRSLLCHFWLPKQTQASIFSIKGKHDRIWNALILSTRYAAAQPIMAPAGTVVWQCQIRITRWHWRLQVAWFRTLHKPMIALYRCQFTTHISHLFHKNLRKWHRN